MKIRMDFVTNSSSSSFLVAQKKGGQLSQKSRDKFADLLIHKFLDKMKVLNDLTAENIRTHEQFEYKNDDVVNDVAAALKDGFQIKEGYISWEEAEGSLADILSDVLEILDEDDGYRLIEGDLSY